MKNEILESLRPWDCEIFDKDPCSPFICYGGGGGSPKINIPKKPHFVSEIQKQAQAGADTTASNWEGGKKAMQRRWSKKPKVYVNKKIDKFSSISAADRARKMLNDGYE